MIPNLRIYVSASLDHNLNDNQKAVKDAIFQKLRLNDLDPWGFKKQGPLRKGWSFKEANKAMLKCQGAIVLAFAQWNCYGLGPRKGQDGFKPSEGNHFEGGLAMAHDVPLLVVREKGTLIRGILSQSPYHAIVDMPKDSTTEWVNTCEAFQHEFGEWYAEVKARPRVFLGYCSEAEATANKIILYLEHDLNIKVCNYLMDFVPGPTILEEISKAARECSCGIFLFTKDEELITPDGKHASPRDNVIFEAGYFTHAKGKEKTLIIREKGVRMPADIGGNIYIALNSRDDISAIHTQLRRFLEQQL